MAKARDTVCGNISEKIMMMMTIFMLMMIKTILFFPCILIVLSDSCVLSHLIFTLKQILQMKKMEGLGNE